MKNIACLATSAFFLETELLVYNDYYCEDDDDAMAPCPTPFLVLKVHLNFCSSTHLLVHAPPYCAADDHPGKDEKNVYNGDDDDPLVKKF